MSLRIEYEHYQNPIIFNYVHQINPVMEFHENLSNNNENAIFIDCSYQVYMLVGGILDDSYISTISIYH